MTEFGVGEVLLMRRSSLRIVVAGMVVVTTSTIVHICFGPGDTGWYQTTSCHLAYETVSTGRRSAKHKIEDLKIPWRTCEKHQPEERSHPPPFHCPSQRSVPVTSSFLHSERRQFGLVIIRQEVVGIFVMTTRLIASCGLVLTLFRCRLLQRRVQRM